MHKYEITITADGSASILMELTPEGYGLLQDLAAAFEKLRVANDYSPSIEIVAAPTVTGTTHE